MTPSFPVKARYSLFRFSPLQWLNAPLRHLPNNRPTDVEACRREIQIRLHFTSTQATVRVIFTTSSYSPLLFLPLFSSPSMTFICIVFSPPLRPRPRPRSRSRTHPGTSQVSGGCFALSTLVKYTKVVFLFFFYYMVSLYKLITM